MMNKIICLDAGHGGTDPGASGNGVIEKNITLDVVKKAGKMLESNGFKVIYTRTTDSYPNLNERCKIANYNNVNLFISVHVNSAANISASGTETLCYSQNSFAKIMQNNLIKSLHRKDRGVKERKDLAVLNGTKMLSILVELAFLSNKEEAELLKKDSFLSSAAKAITNAVCDYYTVKNVTESIIINNTTKPSTNKIEQSNVPTNKNILVKFKDKTFTTNGYFINGKNYFSADFIKLLGFNVSYDNDSKTVIFVNNDEIVNNIIVDGNKAQLNSIFRDDLNYVKLRDLEKLGIIKLDWVNNTIYINTK